MLCSLVGPQSELAGVAPALNEHGGRVATFQTVLRDGGHAVTTSAGALREAIDRMGEEFRTLSRLLKNSPRIPISRKLRVAC